jgi:hypothetical protein
VTALAMSVWPIYFTVEINLTRPLKQLRVSRSLFVMQTVIRTPTFLADAKGAGLSDDEQDHIVAEISRNPLAGDIMEGD